MELGFGVVIQERENASQPDIGFEGLDAERTTHQFGTAQFEVESPQVAPDVQVGDWMIEMAAYQLQDLRDARVAKGSPPRYTESVQIDRLIDPWVLSVVECRQIRAARIKLAFLKQRRNQGSERPF